MTDKIIKLAETKTLKELDDFVYKNVTYLDFYPELWIYVRNAKRRIMRLQVEKMKTWSNQLN